LAFVADATYTYIDKSANNDFQRLTYNKQKKRLKPMTICSTDGRIVDFYGLYVAVNNDATILTHVLDSNDDFKALIREGDIFLLDRGFRDCVKELSQKYQIQLQMPTCNINLFLY